MLDVKDDLLPLGKFLWTKMEAILLVGNVVVLTEDAAKIAPREEDAPRAIVPLYARLLTEVRRYGVHTGCRCQRPAVSSTKACQCEIHDVCANQACSSLFESIDTT